MHNASLNLKFIACTHWLVIILLNEVMKCENILEIIKI